MKSMKAIFLFPYHTGLMKELYGINPGDYHIIGVDPDISRKFDDKEFALNFFEQNVPVLPRIKKNGTSFDDAVSAFKREGFDSEHLYAFVPNSSSGNGSYLVKNAQDFSKLPKDSIVEPYVEKTLPLSVTALIRK